jgi:transposase InsO family protein
MSAEGKAEIIALVEKSQLPRIRALAQLGLPCSTYYRWLKRLGEGQLKDKKGGSTIPWNKVRPEEEAKIFAEARASPELSCRQLALTLTDNEGIYLSESTIYRLLKKAGLIKRAEVLGFKAASEYRHKTKRPNELWASDCSHLKVIGWGWYYLVSVMDDYSRFILAWDLKKDMTGRSLEDVVQQAVDVTGMTDVPIENRSVLLTDNGAGYISQQFNEYLRLVGIRHITASPFHPQTNGKIERYHRTLKGGISQVPHEMPSDLKETIRGFIEYYNYKRYHEGLRNVTPYDVYTGKRHEIIRRRKEVKERTLAERRVYNRAARNKSNAS